ncbi:hypothetical protein CH296_11140 [Rhodococcus sp. 14-2496-1d]|uniref:hypothetical protein n=1 Tax=Rhodococcus sp. 14-2496-1d TaxID=2023146 RepID=UPI000B9AD0C4|nr:hypothetical protein [Rhodococcus sp. 14-2496-1d]OZF33183.1 hypothetical protein CH296_11140 [Rhodococcus sp. 14-2496-1d]
MSATGQIGEIVAFVATVAAARQEATPEQLEEMQRKLVPQLVAMRATKSIDGAKTVLREIMGAEWKPRGELAVSPESALTLVEQGLRERGHDPAVVFAPPK